jgi:hypothetical protein
VEGVVRLNGKLSNAFLMERGVKQGDSLSPLLFIAFMDEVLKMCKRRTERMRVGYWKMRPVYFQALLYADDIVLIADSEEKLHGAVIEWTDRCMKFSSLGCKFRIKFEIEKFWVHVCYYTR